MGNAAAESGPWTSKDARYCSCLVTDSYSIGVVGLTKDSIASDEMSYDCD